MTIKRRTSTFSDMKWLGRLSPTPSFKSQTTSCPVPDSNPYDIKILYTPLENEPVADLIFVHGLQGHREHTWTHETQLLPWPKNLLPSVIPNVRIMTFGYDANSIAWRASVSINRIGDHSKNLLAALARQRQDNTTSATRPLIFVAHSLGGLLCKDALICSKSSPDQRMRRIYDSTRGVIFLGTPHTGASLATAAHRLVRVLSLTTPKSNTRLLSLLKKNSEVLSRIQTDFYTLLLTSNIHVTCFYEELKYPGIGDVIVPVDSAVLPGYTGIGIHAHHKDIARFASQDSPGFDSVVGELKRWVQEIIYVPEDNSGNPNEGQANQPMRKESDGGTRQRGIEIWGDVIKSSVVNGSQIVYGDLTFNGS